MSMLHTLHAKENGAKVIVVDPRFTRTAAKADHYFRIRSGTDVAFLWGMLYHIFQNGWEDKEYIKARVYGMDKVQRRGHEVDAGRGAERHRHAGGARPRRRRGDGQESPEHDRVGDGPDPAHQRQRDRSRELHPAACARQRRRPGRRLQHLPRPRQRAGRDRRRAESRLAAGLLRSRGRFVQALVPRVERRLRVAQGPVRSRHDGQARDDGVAVDRRRAGEERADRPGLEHPRDVLLGPRAELADPRSRDEDGDGQARSPGRDRSVSVGHRGDGGDAEGGGREVRCERQP